nr:hypothetical protein [Tanacetum cinerariifolium]
MQQHLSLETKQRRQSGADEGRLIRVTSCDFIVGVCAYKRALAHIVLAKKEIDMTSVAHVLLRLPPTQDPHVSMGAKEIDHLGGCVVAANFRAVCVELVVPSGFLVALLLYTLV